MLCELLLEFTYHRCSLSNIILRRFHHNWWWVQKCNNKRQYQRTLFTLSYLQTQDDLGAVFTSDPIALLTDPSWLQKFDATIAIHSSNKDVQAKLFKCIILPPSPGWCWQINLGNDHMPHPGLWSLLHQCQTISVKHQPTWILLSQTVSCSMISLQNTNWALAYITPWQVSWEYITSEINSNQQDIC